MKNTAAKIVTTTMKERVTARTVFTTNRSSMMTIHVIISLDQKGIYMAEILTPSHIDETIEHKIEFDLIKDPSGGYSFNCEPDGTPTFDPDYEEVQKENYDYCLAHPELYYPGQVRTIKRSYRVPAKAKCECGETIELVNEYMGACECPFCGQWHNLFGQALNDPSTWSSGDDW